MDDLLIGWEVRINNKDSIYYGDVGVVDSIKGGLVFVEIEDKGVLGFFVDSLSLLRRR